MLARKNPGHNQSVEN